MRHRKQVGYIYKRHGWWWLRWREWVSVNGKTRLIHRAKQLAPVDNPHHKTKASLRLLAQEVLRPLNEHRYSPETITNLGDFVEGVYLPHVAEQKRASTYHGYRTKWRDYLAGRCSDWWMREVRTCDVQHLLDGVARQHDLSRTTLRHIKALMSGIFNYAKQQGYFDGINPLQGVAIPRARPGGDTYAYSLEDLTRMLMVLPEPAATVVGLAGFTGLRRGGIRGLTWENDNGEELSVTRSVWNSIVDEPKTAKSKTPVPIITPMRAMLDAHRTNSGRPDSGPIFANSLGRPLCLNNLANRVIIPALNRCAVCGKSRSAHGAGGDHGDHPFRRDSSLPQWRGWHAFRRGLATNLYRLGVPDKTIQAILRHANLQTTMNVYVKSVDADSVKAMKALEALMCAKCAPEAPTGAVPLAN